MQPNENSLKYPIKYLLILFRCIHWNANNGSVQLDIQYQIEWQWVANAFENSIRNISFGVGANGIVGLRVGNNTIVNCD